MELIGKDGERLHTARSRNDQIVLDEKLFLKDAVKNLIEEISSLQRALVVKSEETFPFIMPAYTHLQQSQPVLLSHHLLAYAEMLVQLSLTCSKKAYPNPRARRGGR